MQFHVKSEVTFEGHNLGGKFQSLSTVWKFQDFSVTQILREINYGESRSSKTAVFAILGVLNFVNLVNFKPTKSARIMKIKFQTL